LQKREAVPFLNPPGFPKTAANLPSKSLPKIKAPFCWFFMPAKRALTFQPQTISPTVFQNRKAVGLFLFPAKKAQAEKSESVHRAGVLYSNRTPALYYRVVVFNDPLQGHVLHCKGCCGLVSLAYRKTVLEKLQPQPFADLLIS